MFKSSEKDSLETIISKLIIKDIKTGIIKSKTDLRKAKIRYSRIYPVNGLIRTSTILMNLNKKERKDKNLISILIRKPIRTISGVAIVAVMCKPGECPGKCIYCPNKKDAPRSYTGKEPAAMRAAMHKYNPYEQTKNRIETLESIGHKTDKIELIIMGGTFPFFDQDYQENFIKACFDAMNKKTSETLEEAHILNETSKHRCVALTIETRPDFATQDHIDNFLRYGATRIELGVQAPSDIIYKEIKRGHTLKTVIDTTRRLKDAGYKICYHYMPGLTKNKEEDIKLFKSMFDNPDMRPDMLKIYPLLLIKGTRLYEEFKKGRFTPYTNTEAIEIIAKMKTVVPNYVRIMRIQRDIPAGSIEQGVTYSNLREMVEQCLTDKGDKCNCIRCREAGHLIYKKKGLNTRFTSAQLHTTEYTASKGTEHFISYEDKNQEVLYGYVRMRFPYSPERNEIIKDSAIIRELKVVGTTTPIGAKEEDKIQHKGIGKMLMKEAEKIAKDKKKTKMVVISAIGTREYYRKLGYRKDGCYMTKRL